jgi:chromosomal replication initiation ATPase DnaA
MSEEAGLQRAMRCFQAARSDERLCLVNSDDSMIILRRRNMDTERKTRRELLIELSKRFQNSQKRDEIKRIRMDHHVEDLDPVVYPSIALICHVVQTYFGMTRVQFEARRHELKVVRPRHIAIHLAREMTPCSYPRIGREIGGGSGPFNHTTVIHALRKIKSELLIDSGLREQIKQLKLLVEAEFEKEMADKTDSPLEDVA